MIAFNVVVCLFCEVVYSNRFSTATVIYSDFRTVILEHLGGRCEARRFASSNPCESRPLLAYCLTRYSHRMSQELASDTHQPWWSCALVCWPPDQGDMDTARRTSLRSPSQTEAAVEVQLTLRTEDTEMHFNNGLFTTQPISLWANTHIKYSLHGNDSPTTARRHRMLLELN